MSSPSSAPPPTPGAPGSPWSHILRLEVISPSAWVRLGRMSPSLPVDGSSGAVPFQLVPTPENTRHEVEADRIRVSLPAANDGVVRLLLAPGWEPHLDLLAHGGRFGYDYPDRRTAFRSVSATVGNDGTVELPVVDRLAVTNDGGAVNVHAVRQHLDLRAIKGAISVVDASRAGADLETGQLGLISFENSNPRWQRVHRDSGRIRYAEVAAPTSSVDRARTAFGPAPARDPAEPDQPPSAAPAKRANGPSNRRRR